MNEDLKKRTKDFALRIIRLYAAMPKSREAQVVGKNRYFDAAHRSVHNIANRSIRSLMPILLVRLKDRCKSSKKQILARIDREMGVFPQVQLVPIRNETGELKAILITIVKR